MTRTKLTLFTTTFNWECEVYASVRERLV